MEIKADVLENHGLGRTGGNTVAAAQAAAPGDAGLFVLQGEELIRTGRETYPAPIAVFGDNFRHLIVSCADLDGIVLWAAASIYSAGGIKSREKFVRGPVIFSREMESSMI
jgi:hypothetical protein